MKPFFCFTGACAAILIMTGSMDGVPFTAGACAVLFFSGVAVGIR